MVPIPINPSDLTFKNVPPVPTTNPVPTVKMPTELLNISPEEVAKSPLSLNKTLPLFPGGATVIVATMSNGTALAVTLLPANFS